MFVLFAIIALLMGAPGWAIFWLILFLLFETDND